MGKVDRAGAGPGASGAAAGRAEQVTVPEGHAIALHAVSPLPRVGRVDGGAWLAHLGLGSDEMDETLEQVLSAVDELARGERGQVFTANIHGPLSLLFAPSDPAVTALPALLVWTLDTAALAGAPRGPALLQRLLRRIHELSVAGVAQAVFAINNRAPAARAAAALFRELRVEVREPEPKDGSVLAEVRRPEGVTLSALLGAVPEGMGGAGSWAREVNEAKDRASGDPEALRRIEHDELRTLESRLAPEGGARRITAVDRAPRLRGLLLAVTGGGGPAARRALHEELLRREIPLLFMIDPKTRGASLRSWPGGLSALPVYADNASLLRSAQELGMAQGSFGVAQLRATALFEWGAPQGWAVAVGLYNEAGKPVYVVLSQEDVRALAKGEVGA